MQKRWANQISFDEVCRRAGGRRRYNAQRGEAAQVRQCRVEELLKLYGMNKRGVQARIARELGVSEATVSRDVGFIRMMDSILAKYDRREL